MITLQIATSYTISFTRLVSYLYISILHKILCYLFIQHSKLALVYFNLLYRHIHSNPSCECTGLRVVPGEVVAVHRPLLDG